MTREISFVKVKMISGNCKSNELFNWVEAEKSIWENLHTQTQVAKGTAMYMPFFLLF